MKSKLSQNRRIIIEGGAYTPFANELLLNPQVPHTVVRVFGIITSFDPSYPSVRQIGKLGGLGKGTVMQAIKWLKDHKVMTYRSAKSRLKTNQYYLLERESWSVPKPKSLEVNVEDGSGTDPDCTDVKNPAVSTNGTSSYPEQAHNKSNTKKSNYKKSNKELYYDNVETNIHLPNQFIKEAITAYQNIFADHFGGQRYLNKYAAQFEDAELQETFIAQSIKFSSCGGTIYGRIKNEFDRLLNQKTRYAPQPKYLTTDASVVSYQMAIGDHLKKLKWPNLIYPLTGEAMQSESFDADPEMVLVKNTIDKVLSLKGIENFERWRLEEQPTDVVQMGPYLFHYYIIKCHLHFGLVSDSIKRRLLAYEKKIGTKLLRPEEVLKIQGFNLQPRSLVDKVYSPKVRPLKRQEVDRLANRIVIPDDLNLNFAEENQRLCENTKERDIIGQRNIKSQPDATALGGANE